MLAMAVILGVVIQQSADSLSRDTGQAQTAPINPRDPAHGGPTPARPASRLRKTQSVLGKNRGAGLTHKLAPPGPHPGWRAFQDRGAT